MHRLTIAGPPGSGKGSLAEALKQIYKGIAHISTGDLLRENLAKGTQIGIRAKSYMERGLLVPDALVNGMLQERLSELGYTNFLLDGYPRNPDQVYELAKMVVGEKPLDFLVYLECDDVGLLKKRTTGRRVCSKGGCVGNYNIYFVEFQPKVEGVCNVCGSGLVQRTDDNEEKFEKRWSEFEYKTKPAIYMLARNYSVPRALIDAGQDRIHNLKDLCAVLNYDFNRLSIC